MNAKLSLNLQKYANIDSFEQFFNFLDDYKNNTHLDKSQKSFIHYKCKQYYQEHILSFNHEQFLSFYYNHFENFPDSAKDLKIYLSKVLNACTIAHEPISDQFLNAYLSLSPFCSAEMDSYLPIVCDHNKTYQIKRISQQFPVNFRRFIINKYEVNKELIDFNSLDFELFFSNNSLHESLAFQNMISEKSMLQLIEKAKIYSDIGYNNLFKFLKPGFTSKCQEALLSKYLALGDKDLETLVFACVKFDKNIIEKSSLTDFLMPFLDQNYTIDLQHTILDHDTETGERYLSYNFTDRKIQINGVQNLIFIYTSCKYTDTHMTGFLKDFTFQFWDQINQPVIEKINGIEFPIDIFEFILKNSQYNSLLIPLQNFSDFFNDKQHQINSNIILNLFLEKSFDYDFFKEIITNLPDDKFHIYQSSFKFIINSFQNNYKKFKDKIETIESIFLFKSLSNKIHSQETSYSNALAVKSKI